MLTGLSSSTGVETGAGKWTDKRSLISCHPKNRHWARSRMTRGAHNALYGTGYSFFSACLKDDFPTNRLAPVNTQYNRPRSGLRLISDHIEKLRSHFAIQALWI